MWTSELKLDPGYTAGFGQWVSALWAWIVAAVSGMGGWFAGIAAAVGPAFESFLGWFSGPRGCFPFWCGLMCAWCGVLIGWCGIWARRGD